MDEGKKNWFVLAMIIIVGPWKTINGSISLCATQTEGKHQSCSKQFWLWLTGRLFSEENSSISSGPFWEICPLFHALKQYLWDAVQLKERINTYPEENPFLIRLQGRQIE